jgi:hypothetical protein
MPYHFVCPHCHAETLVEDEYSGQSGPCYACGEPVALPDFVADLPPDSVSPAKVHGPSRVGPVLLIVCAGVGALALTVFALMTFALPGVYAIRSAGHRATCERNLRRIGEALLAYHDEHGEFPPAYVTDDRGRPMHSWRVLILPYLGEDGLYKRYNFKQPWDSPQNLTLTNQMPDVFACPADRDAKLMGETNYMVVVGRTTAFPRAASCSLPEISDDPSTTLLVTESRTAGVTWLEPKDLDASRIQYSVDTSFEREIGSHHRSGVYALMADGTVRFIHNHTPEEYVRAVTTIAGGEEISDEMLDE